MEQEAVPRHSPSRNTGSGVGVAMSCGSRRPGSTRAFQDGWGLIEEGSPLLAAVQWNHPWIEHVVGRGETSPTSYE